MRRLAAALALFAVAAWMAGWSAHAGKTPAQPGYASVCGLQAPSDNGGGGLPEQQGECCPACPGGALPLHVAPCAVAAGTGRGRLHAGGKLLPAGRPRAGHAPRAPPFLA